jgi:hypothetical protein
MAYTYSQINIHAVFTVMGREDLISPAYRTVRMFRRQKRKSV